MLAYSQSATQKPTSASPSGTDSRQKVTQTKAPLKHHATDTVGVVDGVVIAYGDFKAMMYENLKTFVKRTHDNVVTDSLYTVIVDSTWDKAVSDIIMEREIAKRGLSLSDDAVIDSLSHNPPEFISAQFTDSLGVVHREYIERSFKAQAQDSLIRVILMSERIRLETERLMNSVLASSKSKARTPRERQKVFDAWLRTTRAALTITDRRTMFGFY